VARGIEVPRRRAKRRPLAVLRSKRAQRSCARLHAALLRRAQQACSCAKDRVFKINTPCEPLFCIYRLVCAGSRLSRVFFLDGGGKSCCAPSELLKQAGETLRCGHDEGRG
jgi:hypothetical protein